MPLRPSLRGAVAKAQRKFGAAAIICGNVKTRPKAAGVLVVRERGTGKTNWRSVFCHNGRRGCAELIADAELDLVLSEMMLNGQCTKGAHKHRKGEIDKVAEIRIAVLAADRPIVGQRILDAAANSPAGAGS